MTVLLEYKNNEVKACFFDCPLIELGIYYDEDKYPNEWRTWANIYHKGNRCHKQWIKDFTREIEAKEYIDKILEKIKYCEENNKPLTI